MKSLALLFVTLAAASCAHYGNRTVASTGEFANWEREPFVAGSSFYFSGVSYRAGEQTPISYDEAKKIVMASLEQTCQKNTSKSMIKESAEFGFEDKRNNGGADFGDIILHPVDASMEKTIRFGGTARCMSDDNRDPLITALKEGVQHNINEGQNYAFINLYSFKAQIATAKIRVFQKNKTQISADELAPVQLAYTWKGMVTKQKEAVLESKNVEVLPEGDIFTKVDLRQAREHLSSWNTNTGIRAYYKGKAVKKIFLGTNDQIGTIVIDLFLD